MYFVTDEFLNRLPGPTASVTAWDAGASITDIWVEDDAQHFDIEVISDLRINGPVPESSSGYSVVEVESLRRGLVDRYRHMRSAFNAARPADLIVNCGDLIAGRRDTSEAELRRVESAYADVCLPAFRQLQEAERSKRGRDTDLLLPELLSIPGNEDAYRGGGPVRGPWEWTPEPAGADAYPYYSKFAAGFAKNRIPDKKPESYPVAALFRVMLRSPIGAGGLEGAPIAYIAVIGFDSNDIEYGHDLATNYGQIDEQQLHRSRRLISILRASVARSAPLYVIAVTHHNLLPVEDRIVHLPQGEKDDRVKRFEGLIGGAVAGACDPLSRLCVVNHYLAEVSLNTTSNASGFLRHCQQLRASLVLHANMYQRAVTTVMSTPLTAGQPATELTVVASPAFAAGRSASGMARIALDLWKGQAEIAFHYDTSPDGGPPAKPIQVIRPLISASRVSSSERRLYAKVSALVADALNKSSPEDRLKVQAFADHVADMWRSDGYAPVSFPDGTFPPLGPPTRNNRYYLLLLLRETAGGNYEMLLSRHNPLRPSQIAEWDTLLMPAFGSVRDLMERLHLDVVRQVVTQAEDMERAASAKTFDDAIERIQGGAGNLQDDIWLDKMRELDSVHQIKISPTTGEITDYEYRLVVLTPFVRDRMSVHLNSEADDPQQRQLAAELALVGWLAELPSIRLPGAPRTGRQRLPMEAIMSGGAGLRWEPAADTDEMDDDDSRRRTVLPPGSVWFPLPETDEPEGPWTMAPSIVARNADVMRWVDKQLARRRSADGLFPPHIVLGRMKETTGYSLAEGPFPFAQPIGHDSGETKPAGSTMEAMSRVEYIDEYDLRGQRPYKGMDIRRAALVRRPIRVASGRTRDVILVFDVDELHRSGTGLSFFKDCPDNAENGLLGILRPVQRYVLKSGLERAKWVNDFLVEQCDDLWGFLRATFGGAGEPLALTPPVIEQVHRDDWDSDDDTRLEFLVCDGNHRIVQKVWEGSGVAAAIAVVGRPRQPYYARPFSPYEWDITAGNELSVSPDPRFRYAPRPVDIDKLDVSDEARSELKAKPKELLYRRYYRDLSRGFGPIGGQGGRYV